MLMLRRSIDRLICITFRLIQIRHGFIIQEENECNSLLVLYSSEVAH